MQFEQSLERLLLMANHGGVPVEGAWVCSSLDSTWEVLITRVETSDE